jgi:hypothetical protein
VTVTCCLHCPLSRQRSICLPNIPLCVTVLEFLKILNPRHLIYLILASLYFITSLFNSCCIYIFQYQTSKLNYNEPLPWYDMICHVMSCHVMSCHGRDFNVDLMNRGKMHSLPVGSFALLFVQFRKRKEKKKNSFFCSFFF